MEQRNKEKKEKILKRRGKERKETFTKEGENIHW